MSHIALKPAHFKLFSNPLKTMTAKTSCKPVSALDAKAAEIYDWATELDEESMALDVWAAELDEKLASLSQKAAFLEAEAKSLGDLESVLQEYRQIKGRSGTKSIM